MGGGDGRDDKDKKVHYLHYFEAKMPLLTKYTEG